MQLLLFSVSTTKWISQIIHIGVAWLYSLHITTKIFWRINLVKTSLSVVSILFVPYQILKMINCSFVPWGSLSESTRAGREKSRSICLHLLYIGELWVITFTIMTLLHYYHHWKGNIMEKWGNFWGNVYKQLKILFSWCLKLHLPPHGLIFMLLYRVW